MPEQMSGLMAKFFANLLPYMAMFWSMMLVLFYRTLYVEFLFVKTAEKIYPPLGAVGLAGVLLILPIRSIINKCYEDKKASSVQNYDSVFADFATDYDRENPVTKNEGLVRLMEKKMSSANISEEEKKKLMAQMNNVRHASVADAFRSYTLQKDAQSYYMQSMGQQRMMY